MQAKTIRPARSWDSFRDTLAAVLKIVNPKCVFEYGPGVSTTIIAAHPGVAVVDSVEHDLSWYEKHRWNMPDIVQITYQPVLEAYADTPGRLEKYDLIFVDGREREACLFVARGRLSPDGVVMLHDAERPLYKQMIETYQYKFWTDNGNTVTLTDSDKMAMMLEGIYENCNPPA